MANTPKQFSDQTKLKEIEREIGMRRKVYPGLIGRKMKQDEANMLIAIMEAIAADYRERIRSAAGQPSNSP